MYDILSGLGGVNRLLLDHVGIYRCSTEVSHGPGPKPHHPAAWQDEGGAVSTMGSHESQRVEIRRSQMDGCIAAKVTLPRPVAS